MLEMGSNSKKGVCTGYLDRLYNENYKVNTGKYNYIKGFLKKSLFNIPSDTTIPVVMIGIGCGVAPFIGYIEEREYERNSKKEKYGPFELYFGCRHKNKDFIYGKEIQRWKNSNVLTGLNLAFSRDQTKKIYVQDLMRNNSKELYNLIKEKKAIINVCGTLKMGEGIRNALIEILSISEKYPEKCIEEMEKNGQYIAELWD